MCSTPWRPRATIFSSEPTVLFWMEMTTALLPRSARIAEWVFAISPFIPDKLPANWRDILRCWMLGQPLAAVAAGQEAETLQFVEGGLIYRLPWAVLCAAESPMATRSATRGCCSTISSWVAASAVETGTIW